MSTKREIYCHISNNSIDCNGLELFTIIDDFYLVSFSPNCESTSENSSTVIIT